MKYEALEDQDNAISVTRVVYDDKGVVVGFFTLSADSISRKKINHDHSGVPGFHYPHYPAIKLARMATDRRYEGRGVGKLMLNHSLSLARDLSKKAGCCILTLDAKLLYESLSGQKSYAMHPILKNVPESSGKLLVT